MRELKGYRTLIAGILGMATLLVGLWLVAVDHRHEGYFAFATGVGCIIGALSAKSVGTSAVAGDGIVKGLKNLAGPSKPGDSP